MKIANTFILSKYYKKLFVLCSYYGPVLKIPTGCRGSIRSSASLGNVSPSLCYCSKIPSIYIPRTRLDHKNSIADLSIISSNSSLELVNVIHLIIHICILIRTIIKRKLFNLLLVIKIVIMYKVMNR